MEQNVNALPPEGGAKPAPMPPQTAGKHYDVTERDRRLLLGTAAFCVLLAHTFLWCGPGAGLTAAVFAWYVLVLASVGTAPLAVRSNRVLLVVNLLLAATFALGSNRFFRVWNCLALLVLLPVHALALSGAGRLPWHRPAMLWERLCLLLIGLFGNLGAGPAALCAGRERRDGRRILAAALGLGGAVVLVCVLLSLSLTRQMFRPIGQLRAGIREVELGNLDVSLAQQRRDELGELSEHFNSMVAALRHNQAQLIENQRELNQAQIRMLQAQLNPHFLCNTLDTMKWISKINKLPQVALMPSLPIRDRRLHWPLLRAPPAHHRRRKRNGERRRWGDGMDGASEVSPAPHLVSECRRP